MKFEADLWSAINRYAISVGGDPSKHVYGNTARMRAVVDINAKISVLVRQAQTIAAAEPKIKILRSIEAIKPWTAYVGGKPIVDRGGRPRRFSTEAAARAAARGLIA